MRKQLGLSLIEIMVALAISSFLILGITQIFISNKTNFIVQKNLLNNQESSRLALNLFDQHLAKAGYRAFAQDNKELAFPAIAAANGCPAFDAGQTILPTQNGNGVCFRYQRMKTSELDCLGNQIINNNAITTKIEKDVNNNLVCAAQNQSPQPFISNVIDIQFLYGVDINDDRLVDAYAKVISASSKIVSIRIALLQKSEDSNTSLTKQSFYFPLFSEKTQTASDLNLYKSVLSTVTLRNIAP